MIFITYEPTPKSDYDSTWKFFISFAYHPPQHCRRTFAKLVRNSRDNNGCRIGMSSWVCRFLCEDDRLISSFDHPSNLHQKPSCRQLIDSLTIFFCTKTGTLLNLCLHRGPKRDSIRSTHKASFSSSLITL